MIAAKLKEFLDQHQTTYRSIPHAHTGSSLETAEISHVPGDKLAKAIIMADERGPLMAVIPADYHLDLDSLRRDLQRHLEFADEAELPSLFPDCEPGAIPPIGPAYNVPTIWDTRLGEEKTVYMEAGDHETLLEMTGQAFHELMASAERGHFSHHI